MLRITIFILFFVKLSFSYSLNSLFFEGNDIIKNITLNTNIIDKHDKCNKFYYDYLIKNNFVCLNKNNNSRSDENDILEKIISIHKDTLMFSKKEMYNFYSDNKYELNEIINNFDVFYSKSHESIKKVIKYAVNYYLDKIILFIDRTYDYLKKNIIIDEYNEEIIIPGINHQLRYFSDTSITNYDDCLDFLKSLEDLLCFTTIKENIYLFVNKLYK